MWALWKQCMWTFWNKQVKQAQGACCVHVACTLRSYDRNSLSGLCACSVLESFLGPILLSCRVILQWNHSEVFLQCSEALSHTTTAWTTLVCLFRLLQRGSQLLWEERMKCVCVSVCALKGHFCTPSVCVCVYLHASNCLASPLRSKFFSPFYSLWDGTKEKWREGWSDRQQRAAGIWYSSSTDTKIELIRLSQKQSWIHFVTGFSQFALYPTARCV